MQDETNNPQEDLEAGVAELEEIISGMIPQDVLDQAAEQGRPVEVNISDVNMQVNGEGGTFSPSETGDVLPGDTATTDTTADPAANPPADPTFEDTGSGTALPLDESLADPPTEPPIGAEAPVTINISDVNMQVNEGGGDFFPTETGDVLPDGDPAADLSADALADPAADTAAPVDDLFLDPAVDPATDPFADGPLAEDPLADPYADPLADPLTDDLSGAEETDGNPETVDMDPDTPGEQLVAPALDLTNPLNPANPMNVPGMMPGDDQPYTPGFQPDLDPQPGADAWIDPIGADNLDS